MIMSYIGIYCCLLSIIHFIIILNIFHMLFLGLQKIIHACGKLIKMLITYLYIVILNFTFLYIY